jgi:uncharacterized heparinase superfamily protein
MLTRPALYWRTARHLRPRQVAYQLLRRLHSYRTAPQPDAAPKTRTCFSPMLVGPAIGVAKGDPWSFRFLNETRSFPGGCIDWVCTDMPKLWRYNLHYFDYLDEPERSAGEKARILEHWIGHNPPGTDDAWEPYTVSLRIANWIRYFISLGAAGSPPPPQWIASLWSQCAWLARNIEYHLLANHLFKNAKALVFAGCYFEGSPAGEWLHQGANILLGQLEEQFLADGGHFERSPMYHAIMVEDLLDLIALDRAVPNVMPATVPAALREKLAPALAFLQDVTLADREIALFNDAAHGIAASTAGLFEYAARLLQIPATPGRTEGGLVERPVSGYFGWRGERDGWLIDCGPVGPDYQPGHAHCDMLSYELVLDGRRIVVDTGVHDYEPGERRHRSRSTAGHNTVMVDGFEQSEIWGVFRVGRRAGVIEARLTEKLGKLSFAGAHDGYRRLPGGVVHRRVAEYAPNKSLEVSDELTGAGCHAMESRVHFAPQLKVSVLGRSLDICDSSGARVARMNVGHGPEIQVESVEQYPEFGRSERIQAVRLRSEDVLPLRQNYTIVRA